MKIAIASDHAGFKLKKFLKEYLSQNGHDVLDLGTTSEDSVDYPEFGRKVAEKVAAKEAAFGVLACGSGIGMCIVANRVRGIRAVVLNDEFDAEMSRRHNDANVACLAGRKVQFDKAKQLISIWLSTAFEGGRHERRVKGMDAG